MCLVQTHTLMLRCGVFAWLVGLFFYTYIVLNSFCDVVWYATLEVEDVSLNCTKRVVVTDIETRSCRWLPSLGCFLHYWNSLWRCKAALNPTFLHYFFILLHFLSANRLSFIKVILWSLLFFIDWCALVVKLLYLLHWLCFVKQVTFERRCAHRLFKLLHGFFIIISEWS